MPNRHETRASLQYCHANPIQREKDWKNRHRCRSWNESLCFEKTAFSRENDDAKMQNDESYLRRGMTLMVKRLDRAIASSLLSAELWAFSCPE